MAIDGTLGSMLQGVSQQPPAVRPDGKVTEQINIVSDVVRGLSPRPALREGAHYYRHPQRFMRFDNVILDGVTYIIAYRPSFIEVWGMDGTVYAVTEAVAGDVDYIGFGMQSYVFEDTVYIVNRATSIATKAVATDEATVHSNTGVISVLGGLYDRTYSVTIKYGDGTTAAGVYTTPDGTASGDATKTSSTYIADQLHTSLTGDAGWKVATESGISGSYFYVRNPSGTLTITVDDDDNQTSLRVHVATAEKIEDLAKTAPHGTLVRITGNDAGNEDDFYLRFNSDTTSVVGNGFGNSGVWEEWYDPTQVTEWDETTMPHTLTKNGATFTLAQAGWTQRLVGDAETNPFPDLVGHPIRDIGGFQSRLVFVGGPWVAMSQTNDPTNFFKKSALAEVDTDPISLSSTQSGTGNLDWIIPFDRDLVILSDPGKSQFLISGSTKMTPGSAGMITSTSFEMEGGSKPVVTGKTILFPFKAGTYAGIKEFFTNDEVVTNGAETITETLDKYLVGTVNKMACSTNFNTALFNTDETSSEVYVYKYLWQGSEKVQSSWSKWQLPSNTRYYFFNDSTIVFIMRGNSPDTEAAHSYWIGTADLELPEDTSVGYHVCLDWKKDMVVDGASTVKLPYPDGVCVQGLGCPEPGRPATIISVGTQDVNGDFLYTIDAAHVPASAEVICGIPYERRLVPTMPFARDRNGAVAPRTTLVVDSFILEYEAMGQLTTEVVSPYRADPISTDVNWVPVADDPTDPLGIGLKSGYLHIPAGERADLSELTLKTSDPRPNTFIELEYVGQSFKGRKG